MTVAGTTTRIDRSSLVLGVVMLVAGLVLAGLGMAMPGSDPNALAHGYMFGWVYWALLTFGCLGLSLLHHCARGHWGFPILRLLEAGGGPLMLGIFGALCAPILFVWRQVFFPWARAEQVSHDPILQHKAPYFAWVDVRVILYFVVLIAFALLNKNWQKMEEKTGDESWWKKRQYYGGLFLVVFVFVMNFIWTDLLMSQYPKWYSTIYGVWLMVGGCLAAFAVSSIVVGTQSKKHPYNEAAEPWLIKDLGNWMLTFTMLWAYFSLSQYLIYWSGNIEEFTKFFIDRSINGWQIHGTLLIATNFFIPFTLLLAPRTKRVPMLLASIAIYLLVARFLDLWYIIIPTWRPNWGISPLDLGMFCLFGGVWLIVFSRLVMQSPLITRRMPSLKEAVDHV